MAAVLAENVANLTTASPESLTTASIVVVKIQSCVTKFEGRKKCVVWGGVAGGEGSAAAASGQYASLHLRSDQVVPGGSAWL